MSEPGPPPRAPRYGDVETYGWSIYDCAANLIATLAGFAHKGQDFVGNAKGRIWSAREARGEAQLAFTSDKGNGFIQLSIDPSHWVRADVFVDGVFVIRAWVEDPWEEKEFWPDGSNGEPDAKGDAAGRISKRGSWLQIRCADFPGVTPNEHGYWDSDDPDANFVTIDVPDEKS